MDGAIAQPARGVGLAALVDHARARARQDCLAVRARTAPRGVDGAADPRLSPTCSSISPRTLRSARNGSSATGSIRRCRGGSPISLYRLTGSIDAVYVLGPLAAVLCFYGVWLLAREVTGEVQGADRSARARRHPLLQFLGREVRARPDAVAVLGLHRLVLLPRARARTAAGLGSGRRVSRRRASGRNTRPSRSAATLGLFLLFDPLARRAWRTPGPYVMALAFAIVIAPNVWWLVDPRLHAVPLCRRARRAAAHWYQYLLSRCNGPRPGAAAAAGDRPAGACSIRAGEARQPAADDIGRLQPPLCDRACARSVPGHDGSRGVAGPAADHDVGLSAVVVRAARGRCCGCAPAARRRAGCGGLPPRSSRCFLAWPVDLCRGRSLASRSCATGRRRPSFPAASWPTPSPRSAGPRPRHATRLCRARHANSRSTMSRSIRRIARTSSSHGEPAAQPLDRHAPISAGAAPSWSGRKAMSMPGSTHWRETFPRARDPAAAGAAAPDLHPVQPARIVYAFVPPRP